MPSLPRLSNLYASQCLALENLRSIRDWTHGSQASELTKDPVPVENSKLEKMLAILVCTLNFVLRVQLNNGTAMDFHRERNPLEPSPYFVVDLVDGYAQKRQTSRSAASRNPPCLMSRPGTLALFSSSPKRGTMRDVRSPGSLRQRLYVRVNFTRKLGKFARFAEYSPV
jgi:hypothetical protein